MKKCVFLTKDNLDGYVSHDHLLIKPLNEIGWLVEEISWHKENVIWSDYDLVIIRSTWDYQNYPDKFLACLQNIQRQTNLQNNYNIVKWNIDKKYLTDLQAKGINVVPTIWSSNLDDQLPSYFTELDTSEIVIKPTISASSNDTFRLSKTDYFHEQANLQTIFSNRSFMVQPFVKNVISEGEYSLFYFGGELSHTVLKKPKDNDFRTQEELGGKYTLYEADESLKAFGNTILEAVESTLLYARVDLVRMDDNNLALLELELIEPSLHFNMDPKSVQRFISKI